MPRRAVLKVEWVRRERDRAGIWGENDGLVSERASVLFCVVDW